jgi:SAM-dependent methyltransferase
MKEIRRVLKPDGHLVVCAFCYLPKRSLVAKRTEDLILKYNPTWKLANWNGMFPEQGNDFFFFFSFFHPFFSHHFFKFFSPSVDQLVIDGGFDFVEQVFLVISLSFFCVLESNSIKPKKKKTLVLLRSHPRVQPRRMGFPHLHMQRSWIRSADSRPTQFLLPRFARNAEARISH